MLKRQRPASPLPLQWDVTEDDKTLPEGLFEPMSKRRRYFEPSRTGSYAEEQNDAEEQEDASRSESSSHAIRREPHSGVREWQKDAGEYKRANSLLHDLHAEQRHRLIFSPTSPIPSPLSYSDKDFVVHNPAYAPHAGNPDNFSADQELPHPAYTPSSRGTSADGVVLREAEVVSRNYVDANRLLRSLVLSRRTREADDPSNP
ncbi:hypothetical protein PsYK624_020220 [Phanerochaete sordida]|uniref:Uncharacterized protein n=1 Tax=Phanerochaete sordida TaxID=48140 RepID=A0A9P3FZ63_9APHY|nr:hypothetical protein PsYK624_020220 [Phanerochaete sordida]